MIYNKSGHPVEVKKISIRLWSLRDEIEAAIGRRMKECEAAGVPLFIEDIKKFYNMNPEAPLTDHSNVIHLNAGPKDDMNSLMESIGAEVKAGPPHTPAPEPVAAAPVELTVAADGTPTEENKTFTEAEKTIAEQNLQGLDTKKPNPILERPYQRQPPDLDKISYGFSMLSDINMEYFLSFTKDNFLQGQSVIVEFLIPQHFMMTAQVVYCNHYARTSRIISSTKSDYRVQCKFNFQLAGERLNLRDFLKSIQPTLTDTKKKVKKPSEDDSLGF